MIYSLYIVKREGCRKHPSLREFRGEFSYETDLSLINPKSYNEFDIVQTKAFTSLVLDSCSQGTQARRLFNTLINGAPAVLLNVISCY